MIENSNSIYVVAHINPDGDAIGSSIALKLALEKIGKDVKVVMPACAKKYEFLPDTENCVNSIDKKYDLLIATDSSDIERLVITQEEYDNAASVIMLDHHKEANSYGDYRYIDDKKSSASEIVYEVLKDLNIEIDEDIATLLYAGIMTDTGCFTHDSVDSTTFRTVADLLDLGADSKTVCHRLNDTVSEGTLRLVAKAVDNMETYYNSRVRYSCVSYEEILSLGLDDEESKGITSYLRDIEGTDVAIYVRGKSDGTNKVSMRSNGDIDISNIAIRFGGGGHKKAAGFTMTKDIQIEKEELIKAVGEVLK